MFKLPKIKRLLFLCNILRKKLMIKLIFCMQINVRLSFKLISALGNKVSNNVILSLLMSMIKHSKSNQSNKFAISLQYHKKEVRNGVHFLHVDKHQSYHKLALSFLMEVARHVQGTQNRKWVIFLQYIKKKASQPLLCSIVMKHSDILRGSRINVR